MNMQQQLNEHTIPSGGWRFRQVQTGWEIKNPVSVTFSQATVEIIKHRMKNPAICAKHNLSTEPDVVSAELMTYNRKRLGIPEPSAKQAPFFGHRSLGAHVADAAAKIRRAAQGTGVILDWWNSKAPPVVPELASQRAQVCIACPKHTEGDWFTVAPATLIKEAIAARSDVKIETPYDDQLKSCGVCMCLMRLKVHCPLEYILAKTKPEIMAEFPSSCWVKNHDGAVTQ